MDCAIVILNPVPSKMSGRGKLSIDIDVPGQDVFINLVEGFLDADINELVSSERF